MPHVGEIKTAKELGRRGTYKFEWRRCPVCWKERYVRQECKGSICQKCACGMSQGHRGVVVPEGKKRCGAFIGEVVHGRDIGKLNKSTKFVWQPCKECGKPRWVDPSANRELCGVCGRKASAKTRHASVRLKDLEMRHPSELGLKGTHMLYKDHCPDCDKVLWRTKCKVGGRCPACLIKWSWGENHPRWKGGRRITTGGYVFVTLSPDHQFFCMAHPSQHTVQEHRVVMAEKLGRPLEAWEVVHHKNGKKTDNRLENLMLLPSNAEHTAYIRMEQHIKKLEGVIAALQKRVILLEAENVAFIHDEETRRLW